MKTGLGVLIRRLFGTGESGAVARTSLNKSIKELWLDGDENALCFVFADGSRMRLRDEGQSCCERRYMRTDDNLGEFIGATLTNLEIREAPDVDDGDGEAHEVQFLVVTTDRGSFTVSNHNEHNGYYGGFSLEAEAR